MNTLTQEFEHSLWLEIEGRDADELRRIRGEITELIDDLITEADKTDGRGTE